jgi:hypothetical protein
MNSTLLYSFLYENTKNVIKREDSTNKIENFTTEQGIDINVGTTIDNTSSLIIKSVNFTSSNIPNDCFMTTDLLNSYVFINDITIPSTIKNIGQNAFKNTKAQIIGFDNNDNTIVINENAFANVNNRTLFDVDTQQTTLLDSLEVYLNNNSGNITSFNKNMFILKKNAFKNFNGYIHVNYSQLKNITKEGIFENDNDNKILYIYYDDKNEFNNSINFNIPPNTFKNRTLHLLYFIEYNVDGRYSLSNIEKKIVINENCFEIGDYGMFGVNLKEFDIANSSNKLVLKKYCLSGAINSKNLNLTINRKISFEGTGIFSNNTFNSVIFEDSCYENNILKIVNNTFENCIFNYNQSQRNIKFANDINKTVFIFKDAFKNVDKCILDFGTSNIKFIGDTNNDLFFENSHDIKIFTISKNRNEINKLGLYNVVVIYMDLIPTHLQDLIDDNPDILFDGTFIFTKADDPLNPSIIFSGFEGSAKQFEEIITQKSSKLYILYIILIILLIAIFVYYKFFRSVRKQPIKIIE